MAKNEERIVVLRSYPTIWKYEKKLYSIDSIRLWVPVAMNDLLFFTAGLIFVIALSKGIPLFIRIPWIIRYGAIPYGIMKFFTKLKFDGKLPHKFALGYVRYAMLPKKIARFTECMTFPEGRFEDVLYRKVKIVNLVDEKIKQVNTGTKKKKRRRGK